MYFPLLTLLIISFIIHKQAINFEKFLFSIYLIVYVFIALFLMNFQSSFRSYFPQKIETYSNAPTVN